jgi:GMP synthase (glutamine-hydrolysing)
LSVQKVSEHALTDHLPKTFTTFHWHGDTFNLPNAAAQLFKTAACEQQGFIYNNHVAAIQFHMEVKQDLLNGMIENEKAELIKSTYVQTENEIKQLSPQYIDRQKEYMHGFLDAFMKL